jgi:peroxiredoxin
MVNADFPRLKKNQLSKEQQKKNDMLADKYNSQGNFPYTILIDEQGKVVKAWEGFPNMTPEQFTGQLKIYVDARK